MRTFHCPVIKEERYLLITEVRMQKKNTHRGALKAESSIIFNNCLQVKRINIIKSANTTNLLSMPSIKDNEGHFINVFYPLTADVRANIEEILFSSYFKMIEQNFNFYNISLSNRNVETLDNQTLLDFENVISNTKLNNNYAGIYGSISVTGIRIRKIKNNDTLMAFASVVLDNSFAMSSMKIIYSQLDNSYKLSMPTYKNKFNQFKELYHPINKSFRAGLERIVLEAFFQMNIEGADSLSGSVMIPKTITEQTIEDFECCYKTFNYSEEAKNRSVEIVKVESLDDEQEELFYNTPSSIFKHCLDLKKQNVVFGKIVSYSQDGNYNVRLSNGNKGIVSSNEINILHKVIDYQEYILSAYKKATHEEKDPILKHIGVEYAFEVIGKKDDFTTLLSFGNVKKEFLKYLIEKQVIIKGIIIEISQNYVSIEIPFGYVFITTPIRIFGHKCDETFGYADYINSVVSILLSYDKDQNKLYPILYNQKSGVVSYSNKYIFPYLYTWNNSTKNSKLWLDKAVVLEDKHQKHVVKKVGELFVISNLRDKGANQKIYKGNIKYKINDEYLVKKRIKNILGVHWLVNLKGHNLHTAEKYLDSRGYDWEIDYVYSQNVNKNTVISMSPSLTQKTILPCNIIIRLVVSKGPKNAYMIPNFIGMHINEVRKELHNNNIKTKEQYSDIYTEEIPENHILETIPSAGSVIYNNRPIKLIIYSSIKYASPFELVDTDTIINTSKVEVTCNNSSFDKMNSISWQNNIIMFLLKHKVVLTRDLISWTNLVNTEKIKYYRIVKFINKLHSFGLIDVFNISDGIRTMNARFYVPTKRLVELARSQMGYEGKYQRNSINPTFCKVRASENVTFLKLIEVLGINRLTEYRVDWFNPINPEEGTGIVKIHFAVHISADLCNYIYLIESIRVTDEKTMLASGEKGHF